MLSQSNGNLSQLFIKMSNAMIFPKLSRRSKVSFYVVSKIFFISSIGRLTKEKPGINSISIKY
jgi:hypothetical protein